MAVGQTGLTGVTATLLAGEGSGSGGERAPTRSLRMAAKTAKDKTRKLENATLTNAVSILYCFHTPPNMHLASLRVTPAFTSSPGSVNLHIKLISSASSVFLVHNLGCDKCLELTYQ